MSRTVTYTTVVQEFFTIDADDFYSDSTLSYSPEYVIDDLINMF